MVSLPVRSRPPFLRALGRDEPALEIEIDGRRYHRVDVFKHDSWAATARYRGPDQDVVCKFNRAQSIFGLPMSWLGCKLARREALALRRLAGVRGIPALCGPVFVQGRKLENAVAHVYIPGHPLGTQEHLSDEFFPELLTLLREVHRHDIAYVDLHKRENIVVGEDGRPYLVDFQVCFGLWFPHLAKSAWLRSVLRSLQQADLYHLGKQITQHRPAQMTLLESAGEGQRPAWIDAHRKIAAPLRQLRRGFLEAIGVRAKGGQASTEAFPEDAVRREIKNAA